MARKATLKKRQQQQQEEQEAADLYASDDSDSDDSSSSHEEAEPHPPSALDHNDDDDDDNDDSSVEEEQEEEDEDEDDDSEEESNAPARGPTSSSSRTEDPCTLDLRNLLALSAHPIDPSVLYDAKHEKVNDKFLLQTAQEGCNQLLRSLWQLPVERSDAGPLVLLPGTDESKIPRALPPPPPKQETKWEKFAKEKGIGQNKEKRSRKVWDEATGTWMFRHGFQKANSSDTKEWPIMEASQDDPFADPWEKQRDEKRTRVNKNVEQRMKNEERAGALAKGTTNRMLKSAAKQRQAGKDGNALAPPPVGVPVDLPASGKKGNSDIQASTSGRPAAAARQDVDHGRSVGDAALDGIARQV